MLLQMIFSSPMMAIVWLSAIIIAITVHEFSHALMAHMRGDQTADRLGRLTLNPIAHVDPLGFFMLFILGFGWAKPVPYNPYNLKNPRIDSVLVALAGPASNLVLALIFGSALRILIGMNILSETSLLYPFLFFSILINLFLLFFNLIPVPPLDGSKLIDAILVKPHQQALRIAIHQYGPKLLLIFVILSLVANFDVFFFVTWPAYFLCNLITGGYC